MNWSSEPPGRSSRKLRCILQKVCSLSDSWNFIFHRSLLSSCVKACSHPPCESETRKSELMRQVEGTGRSGEERPRSDISVIFSECWSSVGQEIYGRERSLGYPDHNRRSGNNRTLAYVGNRRDGTCKRDIKVSET